MESKIKTFEDACNSENINPENDLAILNQLPEPARGRAIGNYQLDIINQALNNEGQDEKWTADYTNYSQDKYVPYFELSSGGVWSFGDYDNWCTDSTAGARRAYRSFEVMKYAATQFIDVYQMIL